MKRVIIFLNEGIIYIILIEFEKIKIYLFIIERGCFRIIMKKY